jgi:PD-(D/E)XK nuclease superfamily
MPWARASALHRHLECPGASHLPRLDRSHWAKGYLTKGTFVAPTAREILIEDPQNTESSDHGVAMHLAKSNPEQAAQPYLGRVAPYREQFWPAALGRHEVTLAWDCRTKTHEIYDGIDVEDWKATRNDDSVTGTCDWFAKLKNGTPWIDDYKTGRMEPDPEDPQYLFYLMVRMKEPDALPFDNGHTSATWHPRPDDPTRNNPKPEQSPPTRAKLWRKFSRLALLDFELSVEQAWKRALWIKEPRSGAHCQYCPSAPVCNKANE